MRKMYAVIAIYGGVLNALYLFDKFPDAEEIYGGFLPDFDPEDDDIFIVEMEEDSPGAFSMGRTLRNAQNDWEEERR